MVWYKFWKKSGPPGTLSEEYTWLDKESYPNKKAILLECEYWAKSIPGGHNTSYTYGFEEIAHPPLSALEEMISNEKEDIKSHRKYLKFLQQVLKDIKTKP